MVVHADLSPRFRDAMAAFPSGVTIMTTVDRWGRPWGFTASSFCSLSLDPPLVLVCLAKTARCHPAFLESEEWTIQIVAPRHLSLVTRFATSGADKFAGGEFTPDDRGVPFLPDAPVTLACVAHARHDGGDHSILVARVHDVTVLDDQPLLYFRRTFRPLTRLS
ncbi:flavin reductase family protein [Streptomyces sp. NPDC047043]|uniref:flavin reductase family protein n=1 Tax=Streptomyces sp. NPDC047043 TaxID=3154497 RepID=UPI0033FC02AB